MIENFFSNIEAWYRSRNQQEQQILLYGVPLICLLLVYLALLQPLGSAYLERQTQLSDRQADLLWLRDQRDMLERLNTSCDPRAQMYSLDTISEDLEAASRRFGLVPQIRALNGANQYQLQVSNAQGNRILNLVRILGCGGASVTNLDLQVIDNENAEVNATLEIHYAGSGQ